MCAFGWRGYVNLTAATQLQPLTEEEHRAGPRPTLRPACSAGPHRTMEKYSNTRRESCLENFAILSSFQMLQKLLFVFILCLLYKGDHESKNATKRCLSNRKICSGVTIFTFSSAVNHLKSPFIASTIHCTCSACLIYFIERPPTVSGSSRNPSGRMFRSVLLLLPLLVAVAAVPAERTQVYLVSPPCLSLCLSIR